jgi:endonuclease/exonuclease/phosphatase family metal-dependent hydrolase
MGDTGRAKARVAASSVAVPWSQEDPDGKKGHAAANATRRRQAITVDAIVEAEMRPRSRFVVCGDLNDPPESEWLEPLVDGGLGLVNGLSDPEETRPPREDEHPPASKAWTHRFKESGKPARCELYDHVWLSPALAERQTGAFIERRTKHSGDGSDHDPAWITVGV